ncbi:glycine oxidase ThiO [Actinomadura sp. KC06]|uniref:glycine oxidase ThiO n=1 Tax=Actinomadura sp. KC06 TaxID=2530369 RepID=UPI001052CAB1|nr:glycine oxidase ThiO [Actinomadura sp. KC06]TDD30241.1 glycine oxidase ThiO [Actinomadura sp. KC06]
MEIVIVGAGVIGLATAWRAAAGGAAVTLVDPEPASGASSVAAGMLTPVSELTYGEEPLLRLGLASRDRYGAFVAELEELTGLETGYRTDGIIEVAFDADDLKYLDDLRRFQETLGVPVEALTGRECRRLEPMLAPGVRGGLLAPEDGSIDPRRLAPALLAGGEKLGVRLVRRRAAEIVVERDTAVGVRLDDGTALRADRVLLAAGPWSGDLGGLPPGTVPPVRPVKGQVIRLRTRTPFIGRSTRGMVKGSSVYLVPRLDGEIVVGATQEELGFDTRVTAGGLWELLRDARELLPGVTELEFVEVSAGLRPGSPDNAPVMGPSALPGLVIGTGHFRNGVLLAPISADILSAMLLDAPVPDVAGPSSSPHPPPFNGRALLDAFSPGRFSPEVHS